MPDIIRLRYVGAYEATAPVLGPGSDGRGHMASPGDLFDLAGKVLDVLPDTDPPEPVPDDADYLLVEFGNPPIVRAFPTSLWALDTGKKKTKAEAPADVVVAEPEQRVEG